MKVKTSKEIDDFRDYRPAATALIDLVKHSKRPMEEVHVIQKILEDILTDTTRTLNIRESIFQHTGDGWMCTLFGDDSARAMDFCNLVFTSLYQRLDPYKQAFRAGIDYGIVHFRKTPLSSSPVHFEAPGICSARLEAAAAPNQILCTSTVYEIFAPHYIDMFSEKPTDVQTKDRNIKAYIITPRPLPAIRSIISDLLFADRDKLGKLLRGTKKILVVDDERMATIIVPKILKRFIDPNRIIVANSGEEGLRLFNPNDFMAVLSDVVMPGMSGVDLARRISSIDPKVPVVLMTGYSLSRHQDSYLESGIVMAFLKPMTIESVLRSLAFASAFGTPSILKNRLQVITDSPNDFLQCIERISSAVHLIMSKAHQPQDVAHGLLRHKAKQIANEAVDRLIPGDDVVKYLEIAASQLQKLVHLCFVVSPRDPLALNEHLNNMIDDYSKANKKVSFDLSCDTSGAPDISSIQSVVLLIVFEFIDNAIDAVSRNGSIGVDISWDRTRQQLRIEVTDDGPGVAADSIGYLFQAVKSSKAKGRGMGLTLINDACQALHGSTNYMRDELTVFLATVRCPDHHHFGETSEQSD